MVVGGQKSGAPHWRLGFPQNQLPLETERGASSRLPPRFPVLFFFSQAVGAKGLNPIELML